jgi:hypothetical protein
MPYSMKNSCGVTLKSKNEMIIDSINKQVTNEGGQCLLENNKVISNADETKNIEIICEKILDNKPA